MVETIRAVAHFRSTDKTPQFLPVHLTNVSWYASWFASKIGCAMAGELLGLVHDLGKYSKEFYDYLHSAAGLTDPDVDDNYLDPVANKGRIDHSTAGAQLIWQTLSPRDPQAKAVAQMLALNVASHHSGMIDVISTSPGARAQDNFARRMRKADDKTHLNEVLKSIDPEIDEQFRALIESPELAGNVFAVIDKVRTTNKSRETRALQYGLLARYLFSCLIDADRIDSANFEYGRPRLERAVNDYVPWPVLIERLEAHLQELQSTTGSDEGEPINPYRNAVAESCQMAGKDREAGAYTLTVPTGGGKTLASLRFALHQAQTRGLDRVIYVIPYTSIIDQNAAVTRGILEPESAPEDQGRIVLEHHSNLTPEQQSWRDKLLTENWDAPVVFTTMVQFLESLFSGGTRGARRMHQLANAILVFDEVQTLPLKCVHMFNNAINFLTEQCNSTVLLCTATQPLLDGVNASKGAIRLAPTSELVADVTGLFQDLRRVRVHYGRKERSYVQIAHMAAAQMQRAGSCLVIVNTTAAARAVYQACRELVPDDALFHLSTRMCAAHRSESLGVKHPAGVDTRTIIGRLKTQKPVLCISTQLIEAGIDVDFGCVIRSLAGLDSIAQAAGRCNRHGLQHDRYGRPAPGRVLVVRCTEERLDQLEDIRIGQNCAQTILDHFAGDPSLFDYDLLGPKAMSHYYESYFFERAAEMAYKLSPAEAAPLGKESGTLLELLSDNHLAFKDTASFDKELGLRQSFMAAGKLFKAIDAPTEGIIVHYGEGRQIIDELLGGYVDPARQYELVRKAQRYTVNVFPWMLDHLKAEKAVQVIPETQIHLLVSDDFYDPQVGLVTEVDDDWRRLNMVG